MKRLSLNDTWKYCLRMWKWIAERRKEGDKRSVNVLKEVWLEGKNFGYIINDCFFCNYDTYSKRYKDACTGCPSRRIDKFFHCTNYSYSYIKRPMQFYKQLVKLNRLRKLGRKLKTK